MAEREILEELGEKPYGGFNTTGPRPPNAFDVSVMRDRMLTYALALLSSRSLVWAATIGGGAMWTFAVMHPETLRLVAATGYCLTVLTPILWRDLRDR